MFNHTWSVWCWAPSWGTQQLETEATHGRVGAGEKTCGQQRRRLVILGTSIIKSWPFLSWLNQTWLRYLLGLSWRVSVRLQHNSKYSGRNLIKINKSENVHNGPKKTWLMIFWWRSGLWYITLIIQCCIIPVRSLRIFFTLSLSCFLLNAVTWALLNIVQFLRNV